MPSLTIDATTPANRLLAAGLERLDPVIDDLYNGVLIIGGLAVTVWLHAHPTGLPVRATRDIDLGIDRTALRLTSTSHRLTPLLAEHGFESQPEDEPSRFTCPTPHGAFLLDLVLPKGASRATPPEIERGLPAVASPGLAYAIARGSTPVTLTCTTEDGPRRFRLPIARLDAMLVMKAGLVAGSTRPAHRSSIDAADALMLATACASDPDALAALRAHRTTSEPRTAIAWIADAFTDPTTRYSRRIGQHFANEYGRDDGATWAVAAAQHFLRAFDA